jgi:hypothetical protein
MHTNHEQNTATPPAKARISLLIANTNNKQHSHLISYLLKMTTPNNDSMEFPDTENLLRLLLVEKNLSTTLRHKINDKAMNLLEDLTEDVVEFLHDDLDEEKHSEDDIRTLVQCVPTALSGGEHEYGSIPIVNASCYRKQMPFIPVLAEEGIKYNVGGDGMRGGLISKYKEECAVWRLSCSGLEDACCLDVIKRLREMGLFSKEDVRKYHLLLGSSCFELSPKRFNYFADWDPSLLKESVATLFGEKESLLNFVVKCAICGDGFQLALSTSLRHYPHELGLLLLKDPKGGTPFRIARDKFGKKEAWKLIQKCLDESNDHQILEQNSETNMYPFMLAAAGDTGELDLVYYLLRRNPLTLCSG